MSAKKFLSGLALGLAMVLGGGVAMAPGALASPASDLEDQLKQNSQEREAIESSLEGTDEELSQLYLDLDTTSRRLATAESDLMNKTAEWQAALLELESVRDRLAVARAQKVDIEQEMVTEVEEMDLASAAMGDVARSAYRGTGAMSSLAVVMNAGSLQEFADSYSTMSTALRNQNLRLTGLQQSNVVNENRQARMVAVTEKIEELETRAEDLAATAEAAKGEAERLVTTVSNLKSDQEGQATKLEGVMAQGEERLGKIDADNAGLESQIAKIYAAEKKKAEERAAAERAAAKKAAEAAAKKAAEEAAKKPPASSKPSTPAKPAKPKPPASSSGGSSGGGSSSGSSALIPPIRGGLHVTSSWGYRVYPITGGWFMHNGVDLRSACGQAQISSAAGTVTAVRGAYGNGTHGNQVMVNHGMINGNNYVTVYNHLSKFAVSQGQRVSKGQAIGYTGATGMVTGCHVHFEVWKNGKTINPMHLPGF